MHLNTYACAFLVATIWAPLISAQDGHPPVTAPDQSVDHVPEQLLEQEPVRYPFVIESAGLDRRGFVRAILAAAREDGLPAPERTHIREGFLAMDANQNGVVDSDEAENAGQLSFMLKDSHILMLDFSGFEIECDNGLIHYQDGCDLF